MEPDGFLQIEVSRELANQWDPRLPGYEHEAKNVYKFAFKDMRDRAHTEHDCCRVGWEIRDGFLWLFWAEDSEWGSCGVNRSLVNLSHVLNLEVHTNSKTYVEWYRRQR